jgi:hypothetical protein
MLTEDKVLGILSKSKGAYPEEWEKWRTQLKVWRGEYYRMSLHIDGACPSFIPLRYNAVTRIFEPGSKKTFPNNWFGIEYDEIFYFYIFSEHPKEDEYIRQWRMGQYKPYTQGIFSQVIDVITGAVFQDSGWVVKLENKEDEAYIDGNNFCNKPLVNYVASMFGNIATDANGYFVVIPKKQRGEFKDNEDIEVDIPYILTKHILYQSGDEIIFEHGGYHWWVTKDAYFRYEKRGDTWVNVDGTEDGYYAHMFGFLPIVLGGGKENAQGFMESWLRAARPYADEFAQAKSASQVVNKDGSYPTIIEADVICTECAGLKTREQPCGCGTGCQTCMNTGTISVTCSSCKGVGRVSRYPGQRMIVPPEDMEHDQLKIVSPPVEWADFHLKNVDELKKSMLKVLHLDGIDQAQSGTAKTIDLQTRYQFLISISNDIFTRVIPGLIRIIIGFRNISGDSGGVYSPNNPSGGPLPDINAYFQVIPPTEFDIKSGYDLIEECKLATDSGMPAYVREQINLAAVDKLFGGDEIMKRKAYVIAVMDFLNVQTPEEIQVWLLNGAASPRDAKLHVMLPNILDNIVREVGADRFIKLSDEEIITRATAVFAKKAPITPEIRNADVIIRDDLTGSA